MNIYLERLLALNSAKSIQQMLPMEAFEPFEGMQTMAISEIEETYESSECNNYKHHSGVFLELESSKNTVKLKINKEIYQGNKPSKPSKVNFMPFEGCMNSKNSDLTQLETKVIRSAIDGRLEANRRNLASIRGGLTSRYCGCGEGTELATLAVYDPASFYGERWLCMTCFFSWQPIPPPQEHNKKRLKTHRH